MQSKMFIEDGYEVFDDCVDKLLLQECKDDIARLVSLPEYIDSSVALQPMFESSPEKFPIEVKLEDIPDRSVFIGASPFKHSSSFRYLIRSNAIWQFAAKSLNARSDDIVLHFSQIVRKPAKYGPRVSWHRDYGNRFVCTSDSRSMIRLLLPLQPIEESSGSTSVVRATHVISDNSVLDGTSANTSYSVEQHVVPKISVGGILALDSKVLHGSDFNCTDADRDQLTLQFGLKESSFICCDSSVEKETYSFLDLVSIENA